MKNRFDIPQYYRSSFITNLKRQHKAGYRKGQPLTPSEIDLGKVKFKLAMHFGLCFGVENAIDIAYRAVDENPGKRIFLLSEMIHNPHVNRDLESKGVQFLYTTEGQPIFPFDQLEAGDIIIIPAFGTTLNMEQKLIDKGLDVRTYNTTCPFVDKVWRRSAQLGSQGFTVVIHGKPSHEETRATFSHAASAAPSFVIKDYAEAEILADYLSGRKPMSGLLEQFPDRASSNFDPERDFQRIGVVNQTTMLASETQSISDLLRKAMMERFGEESIKEHFADTRDTLCYATNENQTAMQALIESSGDLAIIVGGFKSSNTSHLVEICDGRLPAYFIQDDKNLISLENIEHLDLAQHRVVNTEGWFPKQKSDVTVLVSAGASCPDSLVEKVINRIAELAGCSEPLAIWQEQLRQQQAESLVKIDK